MPNIYYFVVASCNLLRHGLDCGSKLKCSSASDTSSGPITLTYMNDTVTYMNENLRDHFSTKEIVFGEAALVTYMRDGFST